MSVEDVKDDLRIQVLIQLFFRSLWLLELKDIVSWAPSEDLMVPFHVTGQAQSQALRRLSSGTR